jgi:hypothetical protein
MSRVPKESRDQSNKGQAAAEKTSANNGLRHRTPGTGSAPLIGRSAGSSSAEATTAANRSLIRLVRLIARQAAADFLENMKKGSM